MYAGNSLMYVLYMDRASIQQPFTGLTCICIEQWSSLQCSGKILKCNFITSMSGCTTDTIEWMLHLPHDKIKILMKSCMYMYVKKTNLTDDYIHHFLKDSSWDISEIWHWHKQIYNKNSENLINYLQKLHIHNK